MKQNQLSCIIPVGPGQKSNQNLIASIKSDERKTKFILVFDSPPVEIKEELVELAKWHPSITTVEVNARNPGGARNAGILKCQTEWVAFFDADDLFDTQTLSDYLDKCLNYPDAIVFSFMAQKHSHQVERRILEDFSGEICEFNKLQIARYPGIWRWVFRYESIKNYRFKDLRMGEDIIFLLEFLAVKRKIYFSALHSYIYSENSSLQLTRNHEAKQDLLQTLNCALSVLSRQNINNANARLSIGLASLIFYSAMVHLEWRLKLRALKVISSFSTKSFRNLVLVYRIIISRLGMNRES